jgi:hypothetical protein
MASFLGFLAVFLVVSVRSQDEETIFSSNIEVELSAGVQIVDCEGEESLSCLENGGPHAVWYFFVSNITEAAIQKHCLFGGDEN